MTRQNLKNITIVIITVLIMAVVIAIIVNKENFSTGTNSREPAFGINEKVAFIISQNIVTDSLKLNWTAKFPLSDYSYEYLGSNTYSIRSYVDFINNAGIRKRNNYFIELQYVNGAPSNTRNWRPLYFSVEPYPRSLPPGINN